MEGNNLLLSILMFILGLIIGIGTIILIKYLKEKKDKKEADSIILVAKNEAEKLKRESLNEAKAESNKIRNDANNYFKEKKDEIRSTEHRLLQRENNIDRRDLALQNRETSLEEKENNLINRQMLVQEEQLKMEEIKKEQLRELERIGKFTKDEAKKAVMDEAREEMAVEVAHFIKEKEDEAKLEVNERAKQMLIMCMQKYAADVANEQTVTVISLPNDEDEGTYYWS